MAIVAGPIGGVRLRPDAFTPGNLVVSTSVWTTNPNITSGHDPASPQLRCRALHEGHCATAVADGTYPQVFNNDTVDGSFGVSQPIWLDEITTAGTPVSQVEVPNSSMSGVTSSSDQMTTSFSSKSELALNDSTDGQYIDFMGYAAPSGAIDVSNSDTPGAIDDTNTDSATPTYRAVAQMDQNGNVQFTETNAYSGNNGRAAILNTRPPPSTPPATPATVPSPSPRAWSRGPVRRSSSPNNGPESGQTPGATTPLGGFNIVQTGAAHDTAAKDTNFRGLTVANNVVYTTKGSGSNGIDTVYFVDTTGTSCPTRAGGGVGLPSRGGDLAGGRVRGPRRRTAPATRRWR